jgi:hypothetical protein
MIQKVIQMNECRCQAPMVVATRILLMEAEAKFQWRVDFEVK